MGEVVVDELAPLHHHQAELGVGGLESLVDLGRHEARVGEGRVAEDGLLSRNVLVVFILGGDQPGQLSQRGPSPWVPEVVASTIESSVFVGWATLVF